MHAILVGDLEVWTGDSGSSVQSPLSPGLLAMFFALTLVVHKLIHPRLLVSVRRQPLFPSLLLHTRAVWSSTVVFPQQLCFKPMALKHTAFLTGGRLLLEIGLFA